MLQLPINLTINFTLGFGASKSIIYSMVLRLSLLIFIPQQKPWSSKNSAESPLQRRRPPPPLLVGDWRFQTTKNNAKETLPKKTFILSKLYQISEGKEKITIFLLFP